MPIDGTIFDIKRYAIHDGPGIRTTVFFKGCPLNCAWCHNPESRCPDPEEIIGNHRWSPDGHRPGRTIGCRVSVHTVMREITRDEIFYDQSGGGVTFSGGEPLLQPGFLRELLSRCRDRGFHTAVDTSGYADWTTVESVATLTDLFLFDLKPMDDTAHVELTGVSNARIHGNLRELAARGDAVVVRLPLVPRVTDTKANLDAVADLLDSLSIKRIDLLVYNKLGVDKVKRYGLDRARPDWEPQSADEVESIRQLLSGRGFDVRIGG